MIYRRVNPAVGEPPTKFAELAHGEFKNTYFSRIANIPSPPPISSTPRSRPRVPLVQPRKQEFQDGQ